MAIAFLIGRIIVGLYFISSGLRHFTHLKMMAGYAGSRGVPMPQVGVPVSGALIVIGGASILLGFHPLYGATVQDSMQKMNDMINFTKNWALMGYTLMILAIPQPWPWSL